MPRPTAKQYARAQAHGGKFTRTEDQDRFAIVKWLKAAYPEVVFKIDYGADAKLDPIQAKHQKDLMFARGWPDLMIYEPRGIFCGLAIEMKEENATLYKANGLFCTTHLEEQAAMLELLKLRGWKAVFSKGLPNSIPLIINYLSLPRH